MSFRKQVLENLSGTHHILQSEKYQAATKDDVLGRSLEELFLTNV